MRKPPKRNGFGYFWMCVKADGRRYNRKWWKEAGFWATFSYRLRRLRKFGPRWWLVLLPMDQMMGMHQRIVGQCELPSGARIGPGLFMPHPQGVILSDKCRVGSEVILFQQVTAGCWRNQSPRIRSRATVFAGAKVIGGVVVGRGAGVGANAVVTKSVPPWHIAMGIPAISRPIRDENASPSWQPNLNVGEVETTEAMLFPGNWEKPQRELRAVN